MADQPKNMVQALRELAPCNGRQLSDFPEWFQEQWHKEGRQAMITILSSAADELEGMQKLNGKLYKTLYPD